MSKQRSMRNKALQMVAVAAATIAPTQAFAAEGVDCFHEQLSEDERRGAYAIMRELAEGGAGDSPAAISRAATACIQQHGWNEAQAAVALEVFGTQMAFAEARERAAALGIGTDQLEGIYLAVTDRDDWPQPGGDVSADFAQAVASAMEDNWIALEERNIEALFTWLLLMGAVSDSASRFNAL